MSATVSAAPGRACTADRSEASQKIVSTNGDTESAGTRSARVRASRLSARATRAPAARPSSR